MRKTNVALLSLKRYSGDRAGREGAQDVDARRTHGKLKQMNLAPFSGK
jgi:hypothetical protein